MGKEPILKKLRLLQSFKAYRKRDKTSFFKEQIVCYDGLEQLSKSGGKCICKEQKLNFCIFLYNKMRTIFMRSEKKSICIALGIHYQEFCNQFTSI